MDEFGVSQVYTPHGTNYTVTKQCVFEQMRKMMLKIAICEDVKEFANKLESSLRIWATGSGVNISVRKFNDGLPLLYCITENGMFDLIFMDVEMDKMNGLEAAAKIREVDFITSIVFVSQYEDYYKDAYNVHPFHFLSKPVSQNKVDEVMNAYLRMKGQDDETFSFRINKAQFTISLADVVYFSSERRHVFVVCKDTGYSFYGKLGDVQKQIEDKNCKFLRIHQSFLVNLKHIKEYHYSELTMSNGEKLTISKDNRKKVREIHMLMMEQ